MKSLRAVARSASQKPYSPSPVQDHKDEGSGDLLSRSPVHAVARDGVDYGGGARHEVAKPRSVWCVYSARSARLYIARLGKTLTGTTWAKSTSRTFRSVTVAHDPGATRTDYL